MRSRVQLIKQKCSSSRPIQVVVVGLLLALLNQSCSRKIESPSLVRLSFSKSESSASTDSPFFVAVNITGPGIAAPILWNWESCKDCDQSGQLPPSVIELTVPRGSSRLVQYFEVRDGAGGLTFRYADSLRAFDSENVIVDLAPTQIGGSDNTEMRVIGRYLTSEGQGPTGKVAVSIQPPNGRPQMRIFLDEIFGGYFHFFAINDPAIGFNYDLVDQSGRAVFNLFSNLNPSSRQVRPSANVAQVEVPNHYPIWWGDNNESDLRERELIYYGYFGPAALNKFTYYPQPILFGTNTIPQLYLDAAGNQPLRWSALSQDGMVSLRAGGSTQPPVGQPQKDHLLLRPFLLNQGEEAALGMSAPYAAVEFFSGDFFARNYNSATQSLEISWEYLPEVFSGAQALTGTVVFANLNSPADGRLADFEGPTGRPCNEVAKLGYIEVARTLGASQRSAIINNLSPQQISSPNTSIVLCPYRGTQYFNRLLEDRRLFLAATSQPQLKLVGTSNDSELYRTSAFLKPNSDWLKGGTKGIFNNFHRLVIEARGNLLQAGDVTQLQYRLDNGPWTNFGNANPSTPVAGQDPVAGAILLASSNLGLAVLSNASTTQLLQFRANLKPELALNFGLALPYIDSAQIRLLGNTECPSAPSPVLNLKRLSDGGLENSTNFMSDFFGAGNNGSDKTEDYEFVWECDGGTLASAAIDRIFLNTPTCFQLGSDIDFSLNGIKVDPRDRFGSDCDLNSTQISIYSPSNASSEKFERIFAAGSFIEHSVVMGQLQPFLMTSVPTAPSDGPLDLKFAVKNLMTSKVNSRLDLLFAKANLDGKITEPLSASSLPTTDTLTEELQGNHFAFLRAGPLLSFTSKMVSEVSLLNRRLLSQKARVPSGVEGVFQSLISANSTNFLAVDVAPLSKTRFFLGLSGSQLALQVLRPGPDGGEQGSEWLTIMSSVLLGSPDSFLKVIEEDHVQVILAVASGQQLRLLAIRKENWSISASSLISLRTSGGASNVTKVIGLHRLRPNEISVFSQAPTLQMTIHQIEPVFNFADQRFNLPNTADLTALRTEPNFNPLSTQVCGSQLVAMGRNTTDSGKAEMKAWDFSDLSVAAPYRSVANTASLGTTLNRATCVPGPDSLSFAVLYWSANGAPNMTGSNPKGIYFNANPSIAICGGSISAEVGGSWNVTASNFASSTEPLRGVSVFRKLLPDGGTAHLMLTSFLSTLVANEVQIDTLQPSTTCTSGMLSIGTSKTYGKYSSTLPLRRLVWPASDKTLTSSESSEDERLFFLGELGSVLEVEYK